MQSNVAISNSTVAGTLKYVTGYTGFSADPLEQSGNYLALHFSANDGASISVELIGGVHEGSKTLDDDGLAIFRITSNQQVIKVTSTLGTLVDVKHYALNLTLEEE